MFEAWILICLVSNPSECTEAQDMLGPYATVERCEARADEMVTNSLKIVPFETTVKWKCVDVSDNYT